MADIWIPGWTRHLFSLRGKPYQYSHNPKGCLHTTEGGSIAGALGAYDPYPPHGIYDWRSREKLQHIPLNLASYSAMDGSDDDRIVQIELVGFAAETRTWPEQALRNIAEDVVKPLEDLFGIPRHIIWHGFRDSRDGIYPYISSAESPIRLTPAQLRDFSGWLGHQHLPSPDTHWDPGALPMAKILSYLSEEAPDMTPEEHNLLQEIRNRMASMQSKGFLEVRSDEPRAMGGDLGWFQRQMNIALAPLTARVDKGFSDLSDDEAKLLAAIRAQPTGGQVDVTALAAQLREGLGDEVAASLGRRLTDDNDPTI